MIETTDSGVQEAGIRSTFKVNPDGKCRLDEMLALDDGEFVRGAYLVLLRRAPDDAGFAHYRGLLRDGEAKIDILDSLRSSEEGRAHGDTVDGLAAAVQRRRVFRFPLLGRLAEIVAGIWSLSELERKQRALENRVYRAATQLRELSEQLRQVRADLENLDAAHASSLENVRLTLAGAIEKKAERHELMSLSEAIEKKAERRELMSLSEAIEKRTERRELTSLTNNLVAMTNARLTKPDIAPLEQAVEELKLSVAAIDRSKADVTALHIAQAEAKAGLQAALDAVRQLVLPLANREDGQPGVHAIGRAEIQSKKSK